MTWEDFDALGEIRAEYVDGRVVTAPSPSWVHQDAGRYLANLLESVVKPGYKVTTAWSWKPGRDEFLPDVVVVPKPPDKRRYLGTPVLCIEVMSLDRRADPMVKASKYASYGLDRYWVLDLEKREMYVHARRDTTYERVLTVGAEPVELDFGAGIARIDLAEIIPDE